MAAADQLNALVGLISGIGDKKSTTKTSGGTTTQQTNVSDAGVQQLLNQILSGSGGVKDIGTRARASGLYNSTTEQNLLQNLYATAANQAELARTPTVTTTAPQTQTTVQQGVGVGNTAATLGAAFLGSTALKALSPVIEAGTNSVSSAISDLLGLNAGSSGTGTGSQSANLSSLFNIDVGGKFGVDSGSGGTSFNSGEGYGLNTSTLGNFGVGNTGQGGTGLNFGMDLDTGGTNVGIGGLGALGGLLGSVLGGITGSSGGGSIGGGGGSTGGSIICTALMYHGLLDQGKYALGEAYLSKLPNETKLGYYSWAHEIAKKIRAGHKGWIKVCLPFARSRTDLLATNGSFINHLRYPLGTLTKFVGEPVCRMIGTRMLNKVMSQTYKGV